MNLTFFDMFSGMGGFHLGMVNNGFECIGRSEIDKYSDKLYQASFGGINYGDARRIIPENLPDFKVLCGGFPCQTFSIAGNKDGFRDIRGTLFYEIKRIASIKKPQILFLENVKNLLSHDSGQTLKTILQAFSELGYICEWQILNSRYFGLPHNRERIFIIGYLGKRCARSILPFTQSTSISGESENQKERACSYITCITANYRKGVHNQGETYLEIDGKIRRLTPLECFRLQGFPDWMYHKAREIKISDTQLYKMAGNSVTVNVIEAIGKRIKTYLL